MHRQCTVALVGALVLLPSFLQAARARQKHRLQRSRFNAHDFNAHGHNKQRTTCTTVVSTAYMSSLWEMDWLQRIDTISEPCSELQQQQDSVVKWLAGVKSAAFDMSIFSRYEKVCASSNGVHIVINEFIEPLVGHMRHPRGLEACASKKNLVHVENRDYMVLLDNANNRLSNLYPGRKVLVDAGTSTFNTSLSWLVKAYGDRGIHFDAIYAWEAASLNATVYWDMVPESIKPRLHFFNAPITANRTSRMNPVTLIRDVTKPGDFVVFKLDIDNDAIESQIVAQLESDECAAGRIAEMFFEKHYHSPDMVKFFGTPPVTLSQAMRNLAALRNKGLRIHYWP